MNHEEAMLLALAEAKAAASHDDVPIGAVVVIGDRVVASAHNEREKRQDPTAHAEVLALRAAAEVTGEWRLTGATLYVTLEPCVMCAGALVASRLKTVVFGAVDPKAGATGSLYNVCVDPRLNHEVEVLGGVASDACSGVLRAFFEARRPAR